MTSTAGRTTGSLVGERLCLPGAAIERQNELGVEPLTQRVLSDEPLQLGGARVMGQGSPAGSVVAVGGSWLVTEWASSA